MKKLNLEIGGHNLVIEDIIFLQMALTDMFANFMNNFIGDGVVLTGCETTITGSGPFTINWNAGYIWMNGEIFQVDAGSAAYTTTNMNWEVVETADPAGTVLYEDGSTVDTYKIRKAALTGTSGGAYTFTLMVRLNTWKRYSSLSTYYGTGWSSVGAAPVFSYDLAGGIIFRGAVQNTNYNTVSHTVIATLPATHRPDTNSRFLIAPAVINSVKTFIHIEVNGSGQIKPLGLATSDNVTIYLDGLRFIAGV